MATGRKTGGRQKGSTNKANRDLRELARQYTEEAVQRAVKIMRADDNTAALRAVEIILDRGHGKPTHFLEVKRSPLDELNPDELRAVAEALEALADREAGPAPGNPAPAVDGAPGGVSTLQ